MVAAWISAETGVGPSIASGSQVCSRNCADLPIAPMKSSRQTPVIASGLVEMHSQEQVDDSLAGLSSAFSRQVAGSGGKHGFEADRAEQHEDAENAERKAEIADTVDDERLDCGSRCGRLLVPEADQADRTPDPTPSQPKNICRRLSDVTSISMAKVNSDR